MNRISPTITAPGRVTLSGGEVLLQPELARELLKACKEKGIHTAIETNLCYDFGVLEYLAPYLDLIMADIKVYDNDLHKEMTGQGNDLIFDNVRRLDSGYPLYSTHTGDSGLTITEGRSQPFPGWQGRKKSTIL